jgi:citrate lyase subunit gamma (acyl carrier protein)
MEIIKEAMAGSLESSDVLVKVAPRSEGLEVVISSEVIRQFGKAIRRTAEDTLAKMGVDRGLVVVEDKGALDCTLRARIQAAVLRGSGAAADWRTL